LSHERGKKNGTPRLKSFVNVINPEKHAAIYWEGTSGTGQGKALWGGRGQGFAAMLLQKRGTLGNKGGAKRGEN